MVLGDTGPTAVVKPGECGATGRKHGGEGGGDRDVARATFFLGERVGDPVIENGPICGKSGHRFR